MSTPQLTVGNYRVLGRLGRGGMGEVYLAEHVTIGKRVAIKRLLPEYSSKPDILQRFFNEARATSLLHHAGLIEIYDFVERHPSGSAFIVMELLEGESLRQRIQREGTLSVGLLVEVTRQIANALGAVHEIGIIHRDLKPDNLFLIAARDLPSGIRAKVLDFGIAKLSGDIASGGERTSTHVMLGTPSYMSPEQCRGAVHVDPRSDVYSLGCVMHRMATGLPPYVRPSPIELMGAHMSAPVPSLASLLGEPLDAVLRRMLAKLPEERFQSMPELESALSEVARGRPAEGPYRVAVTPLQLEPVDLQVETPSPAGGTMSRAASEIVARPPLAKTRRWLLAPAGAAACIVVALGVWALRSRPATSEPRPMTGMPLATTIGIDASFTRPDLAPIRPAPPPVVPLAAASAPVPVKPTSVHLTLESIPAGAAIVRIKDGARLGKTPATLTMESTPHPVELDLELPGYQKAHLRVDTSRDARVTRRLLSVILDE